MKKISYKKLFAAAALTTLVLMFLPIAGPTATPRHLNVAFAQDAPPDISQPLDLSKPQPGEAAAAMATAANAPKAAATPQAPNDPFDCKSSFATCVVYFVSYLLNKLIGVFVILGAAFLAGILQLGKHLYDSPAVLTGFSITLAFANLGFVLAIIIIAIATILRNQTYGVKQLLWKLVVMAVLINFGLVVTNPIVSFSGSMSEYFVRQMGGDSAGLVTNITNAFGPQAYTGGQPPQSAASSTNWAAVGGGGLGATMGVAACAIGGALTAGIVGVLCAAGAVVFGGGLAYGAVVGAQALNALINGKSFNDEFVQMVIGMITSAIILSIFAFTLMTLAVLLVVRYVYLSILLILLPLAWLAWVFPGMGTHFQKWWHLFIRWTFFPAISLFFLYLALLIVTTKGTSSGGYVAYSIGISAGQIAGTNAAAAAQVGIFEGALQGIVLCGLMLGGLYAANALGIAGAGMAIGYAKSAGGWVGRKAKKTASTQGKKFASRAVREDVKNKLQSGGYKFLPKRLQVAAGIGMANVQKAGGSRLVDQESAWAREQGKDTEAAVRMLGSGGLSEAKKFALLKELNNNKKFDPTKLTVDPIKNQKGIDGQDINTFLRDKNRFDKYQQGSLRDDLNKSANGASSTTMAASSALAAGGGLESGATVKDEAGLLGEVGATVDALELLRKSIEKTARNMDKGDVKKQNLNHMYSNETLRDASNRNLRIEQLRALIKTKPQLISAHLPGMSAQQVDNFTKLFGTAILQERNGADDATKKRLDEILESFRKSYQRNIMGLIPEEDEEEKRKPEEPKAPEGGGGKKS
jgi:hypothetical protein